mmetsp:Transcript_6885/g.10893  ORF Transcript_6885/g.10893 Transcript_6885/m.10893 type:complete len:332 (-) Transcript_6885:1545-2540(-)
MLTTELKTAGSSATFASCSPTDMSQNTCRREGETCSRIKVLSLSLLLVFILGIAATEPVMMMTKAAANTESKSLRLRPRSICYSRQFMSTRRRAGLSNSCFAIKRLSSRCGVNHRSYDVSPSQLKPSSLLPRAQHQRHESGCGSRSSSRCRKMRCSASSSSGGGGGGGSGRVRLLSRIEKPPRLPVWPVANGILYTLFDLIGLESVANYLEKTFGGRVAPAMLDYVDTNPFILVVHHRHSFSPLDVLLRPITKLILPEGFPAHPHRGFETITYVLKGGFIHRDSMGIKMRYWAEEGKAPMSSSSSSSSSAGAAVPLSCSRSLLMQTLLVCE